LTPRTFALWAPVAGYMALIFGLSSIHNTPDLPSLISDKVIHAGLYAVLAILMLRALTRGWREPITPGRVIAAILVSTLYGASDELHQYFVPPRQMDAADLLADGVGSSIAAGLAYLWAIIRGRHAL
jgi:VanZ family protein